MAININRYVSQQPLPAVRSALPDAGTASALFRQGAQSSQYMAQSLLQMSQNETMFKHQENQLDLQIRNKRREAGIAYNADEARLQFDQVMHSWMRDAQIKYKDDPEGFYEEASRQIKEQADFFSSTRLDGEEQRNVPRFPNDPEALAQVRGDLYTRGQSFLEKADKITTELTVNKGLSELAKAEDDRLRFARDAESPKDVVQAIADMTASYSRAAGTIIGGDDAIKATRAFGDRAWLAYYRQGSSADPERFLERLTFGRPDMKTDEGMKDFQETAYRTFAANIGKTSEVTLTSALRMGNLTVDQYKDLLKMKGLGPDVIADRTYAAHLAEIENGDVPVYKLSEHVGKWATEGLDKSRIDSLKSAVFDVHDRALKLGERAQKMGDDIAKENGEKVEAKIMELVENGKVKSLEQVRPLLWESLESKSISAERKAKIEDTVSKMLDSGGHGDELKRNQWELDIRLNTGAHSKDAIRRDPNMNLVEKNYLIKVIDEEAKKDKLSPQDKEVYHNERRNVGILYGEKGPMASYTFGEAKVLSSAFQRFDDLVFKKGMHPRDAANKLQMEMRPNMMGLFLGGALPPLEQVVEYANQRAAGKLPESIDPATLDYWIEEYKMEERRQRVFPRVDPMASMKEKEKK